MKLVDVDVLVPAGADVSARQGLEPGTLGQLLRQADADLARATAVRRKRVCFLYIAQEHQTLHSVTAAVELARLRPEVRVDLLATSPSTAGFLRQVIETLGGRNIAIRLLGPAWLRRLTVAGAPAKLPMLLANSRMLAAYDVIVTPERTTAILRAFGVRRAKLVYTQHGAGDRAGPFEPRLRRFDMVFAAGPKQRDRIVGAGLGAPERCPVVGYPKFDAVEALAPPPPALFAEDRPTVLYNPHFDARLGSWERWGPQILAAFAAQDRYNLILAPHIRMFGGADPRTVAGIAPFVGHPAIHVDLGSRAAIDMTYTRMADVYLGDASSQVYEFLRTRKPCLFLNAHGAAWRGDESYRHWTFGPVLETPAGLVHAIDRARVRHVEYRRAQDDGFDETFDLGEESSSVRAARAIAGLLDA